MKNRDKVPTNFKLVISIFPTLLILLEIGERLQRIGQNCEL